MENIMEKMGKKVDLKGSVKIIIIGCIAILLGVGSFIWYDEFQKKNFVRADAAANTLSSSMEMLGYLPWHADDDHLRAVIICGNTPPLFVRNNQSYGTSAMNCGFYLVHGIILEPVANGWSGEGSVRFVKDEINE